MTVGHHITDGHGTKNKLKIDSVGTANVIAHPHPPLEEDVFVEPFRQFFTDDGLSTGSQDMLVDGSSTNVMFWIPADKTKDLYIKSISFVIADASAVLNKFGNITALTNGVLLEHVTQKGTTVLHDGIKTNFDMVQLCGGIPAFGDGTGAFRASNIISNSEGYLPVLDFNEIYGMPFGLRLRAGSTDKIVFTVRDDIGTGTVPDRFDITALGISIIEDK